MAHLYRSVMLLSLWRHKSDRDWERDPKNQKKRKRSRCENKKIIKTNKIHIPAVFMRLCVYVCEKLCALALYLRAALEYAQLSVVMLMCVMCVDLNLNLMFFVSEMPRRRTAGGKIRIMPFMWIGDNDLINMRQWHVLIFTWLLIAIFHRNRQTLSQLTVPSPKNHRNTHKASITNANAWKLCYMLTNLIVLVVKSVKRCKILIWTTKITFQWNDLRTT